MSSQFRENTFITHIITEPPTYTSIIVLSPLDSSVPNQARLLSHSACFIGKLSNRTMLEHHHKLNSPSAHVCMQQSLTNPVTYYLPCTQIRSIPIHYAPPPFQGDSVANFSARSSPERQIVMNADTHCLTLHYDQVRLIMPPPPFEGGGGNHCTSTVCSV